jgi:hypothetical protein
MGGGASVADPTWQWRTAVWPDADGGGARHLDLFLLTTRSHISVVFTGHEIGRPAGVLDAIWAPIICRPPRNWNLGA